MANCEPPREDFRLEYAADAFALAVLDSTSLVGIADLLRFERASTAVWGSVRVQTPTYIRDGLPMRSDLHVEFDQPAGGTGFVRISLPTETRAGYIDVPRDAAIVGLLVKLIGPRVPVLLRIEDRDITVQTRDPVFTSEMMRRIASLPFVERVEAAPGGVRIRVLQARAVGQSGNRRGWLGAAATRLGALEGEDVLPGLTIPLRELFDEAI